MCSIRRFFEANQAELRQTAEKLGTRSGHLCRWPWLLSQSSCRLLVEEPTDGIRVTLCSNIDKGLPLSDERVDGLREDLERSFEDASACDFTGMTTLAVQERDICRDMCMEMSNTMRRAYTLHTRSHMPQMCEQHAYNIHAACTLHTWNIHAACGMHTTDMQDASSIYEACSSHALRSAVHCSSP